MRGLIVTQEHIVTPDYAGPERRRYLKTLEQHEADIVEMFRQHEGRERKWADEIRADLLKAFPGEDIKGHCEYHELKLRAARAEEEFWHTAKSEALKYGISGLFSVGRWIMILAIVGLAYKLGLGPAAAKVFGVTG